MEIKEIEFGPKSMVNHHSTIKRLVTFVHNLEEKLSSVKSIHEKLHQLMSIVSKTHDNILEDLTNIKTVLNQTTIEQGLIHKGRSDTSKSEWDDDDDDDGEQEIESRKLNRKEDNIIITSASSYDSSSTIENRPNSSTSKRSSNLKKPTQLSSNGKSAKSVTFSLDENPPNPQQKRIIPIFQQFPKEKKNETFIEITTPINPCLSSDLLKQHQFETTSQIGKQLTNIRIHEIESKNGDYLRLLNISNTDDYDLSEHFLQQNIDSKLFCRFRFPFNTIIRAGQTVTIWCGRTKDIIPQPPYIFLWKEQKKWETKSDCLTILAKPNGQPIAWYKNCHRMVTEQSSSDILHVHSKTNSGSSDTSSTLNNVPRSHTRRNRFSTFNFFGNTKPPFAHSPNNPIHPDHNGTIVKLSNDPRLQMHQKKNLSQLLNRPKSSPFASHTGCKQDLISMNLLQTQKQTIN